MSSNIKKYLIALTAGLVLAGGVSAKTLNIHNGGDPSSLDPHKVSGDWENRIVGDIFEGLVTEDINAEPIAGQAESWTISDDQLTYTFKLRDDITWTDGTPVTAGDFVFSFQRLMDPETAANYAYLQYSIKNSEMINSGKITDISELGVKAIDDKTLEITLEQPTPYFLGALTHYTAYPLPKHVVEAKGGDWMRVENIVTNGAYKPTEWVPGSHVTTTKNETFHDAANVKIENVKFFVLEDESAALKRYRAGEFDILTEFPTDQYAWMEENLPGQAQVAPYAGLYYYAVNTTKPPFDNADVRQALSMSVNREVIGPSILGTGELPAYSWVPPGMANYAEPATVSWKDMPYNDKVAKAKELLSGAGFNDGNKLKVQLRYNTNENHKRIAVAISAMWKAIDVEVELFNTETKVHYADLQEGDLQVARAGWLADYNDADNFLNLLKSGVNYNYGRYSNPEFDKLVNEANASTDVAKREMMLKQAEQLALDESASIPIYYYLARNVVSPKITGYKNNAFDIHRTRWLDISE
ncbi:MULTISPECIES: peptide ABC transporter substrate-binding protein [unclassified Lentilitoribacter]|uniref:peptide ABC transporter substrate-binding protein n=1 Tax=unclassified Lentilitoribacter TaxID=2647570 RepID=UPI0013A696A9|nr:peptide ABC transporter substrate-binding protein [Lentilitoribacter sp. Alg239-R112]